ncbi:MULTISPECIES: hypothetical protein [Cupriavidus]
MIIRIGSVIASFPRGMKCLATVAFILYGITTIASARPVHDTVQPASSASCAVGSNVIKATICGDPELAERERTMEILLAASRLDVSGRGVSQQQALQQKWLREREKACSKGNIRQCVLGRYEWRLQELAVAALFRAPAPALAEMRRTTPDSASIYEAIYRYATIESDQERAEVVGQLIAPALTKIRSNPNSQIPTGDDAPAELAKSDSGLSGFLQAASMVDHDLTLPCSAIARRPGLIDALDPYFGGRGDSYLIRSDCLTMTPSMPAVEKLKRAAIAVQPECLGSIRFALEREFDKRYVAILLHRMDRLGGEQSDKNRIRHAKVARFIARHPSLANDATLRMATYYSHDFGIAPTRAKAEAARAVHVLVDQAHQLCIAG